MRLGLVGVVSRDGFREDSPRRGRGGVGVGSLFRRGYSRISDVLIQPLGRVSDGGRGGADFGGVKHNKRRLDLTAGCGS